jgi:hypothetical protein
VKPVVAARWTCEQCGEKFNREKSGARPIRFCGSPCYQSWRKSNNIKAGCFKKGDRAWNKGMKGIHLSPATEFKAGRESERRLSVGTVTIRKRSREGYERAFIKVAEPNVWKERAVVVWEQHNGPLPKGFVVHHRDRKALNDVIDNLEALTRAEHINEHRHELRAA